MIFSLDRSFGKHILRASDASRDPYHHILKNPIRNKGTSFTSKERDSLGLHGLIPGGEPLPLDTKVSACMHHTSNQLLMQLKTLPGRNSYGPVAQEVQSIGEVHFLAHYPRFG